MFLQFSPQSHQPQTLLSVSSPLCPFPVGALGQVLQTKFCALAFCVSSCLSLVERNPAVLHSWVPFQPWCCRLGSPAWGLDLTLLRSNPCPRAAEISLWNFSCCPWELSQPSHASFALPTSLVVVKWFLLSVLGYKTSLQLVFS